MSETGQPVGESELQAWADGRLPAGRRADVEAWLTARPEEAERVSAYRGLNEQLRARFGAVLDEPVPEQLRRFATRGARWRRAAAVAGWLAIGVAVGGAAGWELHARRAPAAIAMVKPEALVLARRAALAHATYAPEVRHPVEVGADQEQHLVAWLSKRLGGEVRAPKLETEGMSLVGGRLLPGDPGPVAQFMYQNAQGRRATLYVRTEGPDQRETAFRYAREGNVRVFYWIDRKFGYALSSADMEREELLRLANLVYRQLNP
ncbi:MAG: anti-sigma factor [Betaproteobacteria bacterium]|nr:anti-sigma factor [Betaproteobacteria bacterium]MDH5220380.1 anti-sigma factor [Betaproteobacteria bacterium]MDH5349938.1 anti-sigma factor [Betaproteobacteria bacterium]